MEEKLLIIYLNLKRYRKSELNWIMRVNFLESDVEGKILVI